MPFAQKQFASGKCLIGRGVLAKLVRMHVGGASTVTKNMGERHIWAKPGGNSNRELDATLAKHSGRPHRLYLMALSVPTFNHNDNTFCKNKALLLTDSLSISLISCLFKAAAQAEQHARERMQSKAHNRAHRSKQQNWLVDALHQAAKVNFSQGIWTVYAWFCSILRGIDADNAIIAQKGKLGPVVESSWWGQECWGCKRSSFLVR